jgi:ectoine hydroxylase-related dioxygenase (phytanoyl-CoA dioxygenase family)
LNLIEHGIRRWDYAIQPSLLAELLASWQSATQGARGEVCGGGWHAHRHERQRRRYDWELLDFTPILGVLREIVVVIAPALREVCDFERLAVTHAGIFEPAPGCADQKVHRDGLPREAGYAWSVFLPLVPVRDDNGPTEYFAGSHLDRSMTLPDLLLRSPIFSLSELRGSLIRGVLAPHRWLRGTAGSLRAMTTSFIEDGGIDWQDVRYRAKTYVPSNVFLLGTGPCRLRAAPLEPGTMILHDYRCFHRGTANRSREPRPMLYVNFEHEDYDDSRNYPPRPHRVRRGALDHASLEVRHLLRKIEVVAEGAPADPARLTNQHEQARTG